MAAYFNIAQIIISIALVLAILLQAKGAGGVGTLFGGGEATSVFRTRRGLERTLFNLTIGLAVVFVLISLASVRVAA